MHKFSVRMLDAILCSGILMLNAKIESVTLSKFIPSGTRVLNVKGGEKERASGFSH